MASFLQHLETGRGNTVRTRNARLAALRSFYRFAQLRCPEHAALIARVLAIPQKRGERKLISFLENQEADALLAAPDRSTWTGRRDHALLLLAIQAGCGSPNWPGYAAATCTSARGTGSGQPEARRRGQGLKGARRWWAAAWPAASSAAAHRRAPLPPRSKPRTRPLAVSAVTPPGRRTCGGWPSGPPAPGNPDAAQRSQ